jgi:hypothetical protein
LLVCSLSDPVTFTGVNHEFDGYVFVPERDVQLLRLAEWHAVVFGAV